MKESNIQTLFGQKNTIHGVFELKLCKGTSIAFERLEEHQEKALLDANGNGIYFKINDAMAIGGNKGARPTSKKPFDCFYLKNTPAYVVPVFYVPRKKKTGYYLPIDEWIYIRETADRKSVTEEMLKSYKKIEL